MHPLMSVFNLFLYLRMHFYTITFQGLDLDITEKIKLEKKSSVYYVSLITISYSICTNVSHMGCLVLLNLSTLLISSTTLQELASF